VSGQLLKTWVIGNTQIELYSDEINTIISGVGNAFAYPVGYPDVVESYKETTRSLGYGENVLEMCFEHEAAHTLIAYWMGLPYSPVLYGIITGKAYEDFAYEESVVLQFQRYCKLHSISILGLLDRYNNV
jgi:hypothetical protein